MKASPLSRPKASPTARWKYLRPYLRRHRAPILAGIFCVVTSTALDQVAPWMVKLMVDRMEGDRPFSSLAWPLIAILVSTVVSSLLLYVQRLWVITSSRHIEYALRRDLFARLLVQPKSFFDRTPVGDIMSRATNDLDRIRDMAGPVILHLARMGCVLVYTALSIFFLDPWLLLIGLLPALTMPLAANVFLATLYRLFGRIQKSLSGLNSFVQDTLSGVHVVKAFGRQEAFEEKFLAASRELRDSSLKVASFNALLWPAIGLLGGLGIVLVVWFGSRMVIREAITLGTLSAAILFLLRLQWPLVGLGWVASMIQRGNVSIDRLLDLEASFPMAGALVPPLAATALSPSVPASYPMEAPPRLGPSDPRPASPSPFASAPAARLPFAQELRCGNLTFAYADGGPVLRDIDLVLRPGGSLGIVGPTGAGKSTLIQVLCGIYRPPAASLFLDGKPREDYPDADWFARFAYCPQDGFLFSTSIAANIAMGGGDAAAPAVEEAAALACLDRDLDQIPDGYAALLGEKGINLSGGQRQRVGLARAFMATAPILALDDTLSALDPETEARVLENLRRNPANPSLIVASHRYTAIRDCDHIVYMEEGRILERGTHAELLALAGAYARVWEMQKISVSLEQA